MKKITLLATLPLLMTVACNRAPQPAETPAEEPAPIVFNEENFPSQDVDVQAYSDGIQHIGIPTSDIQRTIDFYKTLGFELATRHDIGGRDFAFVRLGNLYLELIPSAEPSMTNGAVDHFCLNVKNIDDLFQKVSDAGYHMLSDKVQDIAFWEHGARYFFIQGPNNEKIEFCEILQ